MKKLILSFIFITSTLFIFSQQIDSNNYVTNSNVEKLVDKYSAKIEASVISLAQSLKQPAEHVYKVLIKQQFVKAFIGLFVVLLTLLCMIFAIKYGNNIEDWDDFSAKEDKSKMSGALFLAFTSLSVIFLVATFIGEYPKDIIQGFINPEYGAIQDIINFIK